MESICVGKKFINGEDFSAEDLDIFADSVETIARIERERHERRKGRRVHRRTASRCTIEAEVHSQPDTAIDYRAMAEEEARRHSRPVSAQQLRCKLFESVSDISPIQSSDENYYSAASSVDSPTGGSKESLQSDAISPLPSTDSGTESESVFGGIRPRSNALNRSTRARIIGLIMKKQQEHLNSGSEEDLLIKERRERVLNGLLREKDKYEKMLKVVQRQATATTEISSGGGLKSITKAFNWLTL